jgi:DNA polymerase III subunit delta'
MNSEQFQSAWEGIMQSWQRGQLAHAYLLQGAPHGAAGRFADGLLNLIFNNHPQVQTRTHPDIAWVEPQSKSRRIKIDEIREIILKLAQTAFSGGWKAGVILSADRMTPEASNALLKTLEEPSANSLLLLVTDEPQSLLPTISSRCQRIALTADEAAPAALWKEPLLDILRDLPPESVSQAALLSGQVNGLLDELKKGFEKEEKERIPDELSGKEARTLLDARSTARLIELRTEVLRLMLRWQRDLLMLVAGLTPDTLCFPDDLDALQRQAARCTRAQALRRIQAVEQMGVQFNRNLPAGPVFNRFFSQLV